MAKGKSVFQVKGTLNGLNFYVLDGKQVVRTAGGGFNGDAIKTKASMVRVRENSTEFKTCMHSVSLFKKALQPHLNVLKDGKLHQRLVSSFTKLKALDPISERGNRHFVKGLLTPDGKKMFTGLVLTHGKSLLTTLRHHYSFSFTNGLLLSAYTGKKLFLDTNATHFELVLRYITIGLENEDYSFEDSEPIFLDKNFSGNVALVLAPPVTSDNVVVAVIIGRFFKEVNGKLYGLESGVLEIIGIDG
ncbi:hypothetical protein FIA58_018800 [Flavobacterium jejuense]|uniref:Uncharacterized protein n=1 Tax=Flavobacterium jejuense TaxID=1544455 RepID=A0ABX0IX39_9FLAO|nr:hypothetical protein [Flavobacterium jejuense]NHN27736.1 hypothetical protein [Flavobacterium jejuense]